MDLEFIRSNFPAFSEPSLEGWAFFENAGGSYACGQTIEWLDRYYRQTKVQPHYDFPASTLAGEQMDEAKRRMAAWLNVDTEEVHFGPSTSQNTYVLAQALRQDLKPGDEVVATIDGIGTLRMPVVAEKEPAGLSGAQLPPVDSYRDPL